MVRSSNMQFLITRCDEEAKNRLKINGRRKFRSFQSIYNNIRLKDLRVVLTPIMLKITKDGAVKVVQKRFAKIVENDKKQTKKENFKEGTTAKVFSEDIIKQFFIKKLNNKTKTHMKVINNTIKSNNLKTECPNDKMNEDSIKQFSKTINNKSNTHIKALLDNTIKNDFQMTCPNYETNTLKCNFPSIKLVSSIKRKKYDKACSESTGYKRLKTEQLKQPVTKRLHHKNIFKNDRNQTKIDELFNVSKSQNNITSTSICLNDTLKVNHGYLDLSTVKTKKLKQCTLFDLISNKISAANNSSVNVNKGKTLKIIHKSPKRKRCKSGLQLPINSRKEKHKSRKKKQCDSNLQLTNSSRTDGNNMKALSNILSNEKSLNSPSSYKNNSVKQSSFATRNNDLHAGSQKKTMLNQNDIDTIFVYETTVLKIDKYSDAILNRMNSTIRDAINLLDNSLISDLFITINFPCNKLNSLMYPNCVKFTTFPLSKMLFDKVISSCIKIEIKKHALINQKQYYQFFIFKGDLPVLRISVCLNCEDQYRSTEDKRDRSVNFRCLNNTLKLNNSIADNGDINSLNSCGYERRVCYSFDNDRNLGDQRLDDKGSFFILPSLMHFSSTDVGSDKACLQLLLKVVKISESLNIAKSCIFKINQNDLNSPSNLDTALNTSSLNSNLLNPNLNTSDKNDIDDTSCLTLMGYEPASKSLVKRENKNYNILNEIQNKLPNMKRGKSLMLKPEKKPLYKLKDNNTQSTKAVVKNDINLKAAIEKNNVIRKAVLRTGNQIKRKYRNKVSSKVKNLKNVLQSPADLKKIESNLDASVLVSCQSKQNQEDNTLLNYIKKVGENFITNVSGNTFKPSLIDKMIYSFKT